jgi:hypothetical protein
MFNGIEMRSAPEIMSSGQEGGSVNLQRQNFNN